MPSTPCSQIVRACTPNERLGVLGHCKCLPGLMSLMVYGIGSSSPRPPSLQCFANSSAGPIPFSRWAHGVVVSHPPHAEGPGFKSQCVHFVIHMPSSTRVARELRARIPAALSCTSPLTQSLQPNVWHSDLVHIAHSPDTCDDDSEVQGVGESDLKDTLAERSKAVAQGAIPKGRGFEPHRCHLIWFGSSP